MLGRGELYLTPLGTLPCLEMPPPPLEPLPVPLVLPPQGPKMPSMTRLVHFTANTGESREQNTRKLIAYMDFDEAMREVREFQRCVSIANAVLSNTHYTHTYDGMVASDMKPGEAIDALVNAITELRVTALKAKLKAIRDKLDVEEEPEKQGEE